MNGTDFELSSKAFDAMAKDGMAGHLRNRVVDVEDQRIPCEYRHHNLSVRVEERSHYPSNLTVKFLYQGGQSDIVVVRVAQVGLPYVDWKYLSQEYGPTWSTNEAPAGPLQFSLRVTQGFDSAWVGADRAVLPAQWKPGEVYDLGFPNTYVEAHDWDPNCGPQTGSDAIQATLNDYAIVE